MYYDERFNQDAVTPAQSEEKWQQILKQAADLIERNGHVKELLYHHGAHCVMGALNEVNHGAYVYKTFPPIGDQAKAMEALTNHLGVKRPTSMARLNALVEWNNALERTKDDVVNALRAAAERK